MMTHSLYNAFALLTALLASAAGLDNLMNPLSLYNTASVVICVTVVLGTFVLIYFAPTGIEIARPKIETVEEKAARILRQAEFDRVYSDIEADNQAEKERRRAEREVRVVANIDSNID